MSHYYSFLYRVIDGKGASGQILLYVTDFTGGDYTFTQNELNLFARQSLPILRNVIKGGITGCKISFHADLASLLASFPSLAAPDPNSDVEEGAALYWQNDVPNTLKRRLPTFDEDLILSGTRTVDAVDSRMVALIDMILSGVYTAEADIFLYWETEGFNTEAFVKGVENFRKRKHK